MIKNFTMLLDNKQIKNFKNLNFFYNLCYVGKLINKSLRYRHLDLVKFIKNSSFYLLNKNSFIFMYVFYNNYNLTFLTKFDIEKFFNTLKNNFKLFFYFLYENNFVYYKFFSFNGNLSINYLVNKNNYFYLPTINFSNYQKINKSYYKFIYNNFNFFINKTTVKHKNYKWFYSIKTKRFYKINKIKESFKLKQLRIALFKKKRTSIRGKFFYRFREIRERLHPFWQKDEFLKKKFKYFKLGAKNLVHSFYKHRGLKKDKHILKFLNQVQLHFWFQKKLKKFKFVACSLNSLTIKNNRMSKKYYLYYYDLFLNKFKIYKNNFNKFKIYKNNFNLNYSYFKVINKFKKIYSYKNNLNRFLIKDKNNSYLHFRQNFFLLIKKCLNQFFFFNKLKKNTHKSIILKYSFFNNKNILNSLKLNIYKNNFIKKNKSDIGLGIKKISKYRNKKFLPNSTNLKIDKKYFISLLHSEDRNQFLKRNFRKKHPYYSLVDYKYAYKIRNFKNIKFNGIIYRLNLKFNNLKIMSYLLKYRWVLKRFQKKKFKKHNKIFFNRFIKKKLAFSLANFLSNNLIKNNNFFNWLMGDFSCFILKKSASYLLWFNYIKKNFQKKIINNIFSKNLNLDYIMNSRKSIFKIFALKKKKKSFKIAKKITTHVLLKTHKKFFKIKKQKNNFKLVQNYFLHNFKLFFFKTNLKLLNKFTNKKKINIDKHKFKIFSNNNISIFSLKTKFKFFYFNLNNFKIMKNFLLKHKVKKISRLIKNTIEIKLFKHDYLKLKLQKKLFKNYSSYDKNINAIFKKKIILNLLNLKQYKKNLLILLNDDKELKKFNFNAVDFRNDYYNFFLKSRSVHDIKVKLLKNSNSINQIKFFNPQINKFFFNKNNFTNSILLLNNNIIKYCFNFRTFLYNKAYTFLKLNLNKKRKKKILNNLKNYKNKFLLKLLKINKITNIKHLSLNKINWGLNNMLKKNYNSSLKIFKYFWLFKKVNKKKYFTGLGKLWNFLNLTNDGVNSNFVFLNLNLFSFKLNSSSGYKKIIPLGEDHSTSFSFFNTWTSFWKCIEKSCESISDYSNEILAWEDLKAKILRDQLEREVYDAKAEEEESRRKKYGIAKQNKDMKLKIIEIYNFVRNSDNGFNSIKYDKHKIIFSNNNFLKYDILNNYNFILIKNFFNSGGFYLKYLVISSILFLKFSTLPLIKTNFNIKSLFLKFYTLGEITLKINFLYKILFFYYNTIKIKLKNSKNFLLAPRAYSKLYYNVYNCYKNIFE